MWRRNIWKWLLTVSGTFFLLYFSDFSFTKQLCSAKDHSNNLAVYLSVRITHKFGYLNLTAVLGKFSCGFSVFAEIFCGFAVFSKISSGFAVLETPWHPQYKDMDPDTLTEGMVCRRGPRDSLTSGSHSEGCDRLSNIPLHTSPPILVESFWHFL